MEVPLLSLSLCLGLYAFFNMQNILILIQIITVAMLNYDTVT
jgi:hypothetical protein